MKKYYKILLSFLFVLCALQIKSQLILNPYRNVNWSTYNHYKANFHTHTRLSDGSLTPTEVVDAYHKTGYKILSITDHSLITYPWTEFSSMETASENRDPNALGMLAVKGNELSGEHHTGSYINVIPGTGTNPMRTFEEMTAIGGLGVFNHPGRYWNISKKYVPGSQHSIEWYQNFYQKYPAIIGIEAYSLGNTAFPTSSILWDELLARLMPGRPIWGYSNDDMHGASQLFHSFQYMLMPNLTLDDLRTCMTEGASYLVNEPSGNGTPQTPSIDSIIVNEKNNSITIFAKNYLTIEWISGINGADSSRISKVIASGSVFSYRSFTQPYIRAVIANEKGKVFTQPFGFKSQPPVQRASQTATHIKNNITKPAIEWVNIPAGTYKMGCPESEKDRVYDEIRREVKLNAFKMSKYEITFEQYDLFCEATGRDKPGDEGWERNKRPVIFVSWNDANAFAEWMGGRLPTEAEWEYACRAGTTTPYNTGYCLSSAQANFDGGHPNDTCSKSQYIKKTLPVGSYAPNAWGLYDMHGNVYEWCGDFSGDYVPGAQNNPKGPLNGAGRVYRGGSWLDYGRSCRSAYRFYIFSDFRDNFVGFRICK